MELVDEVQDDCCGILQWQDARLLANVSQGDLSFEFVPAGGSLHRLRVGAEACDYKLQASSEAVANRHS